MLSPLTPIGITRQFRGGGVTPDTTSSFLRGDWVETRITDLHNGVTTSRLVRIICSVRVTNFTKVTGCALSDEMYQTEKNKEEDTVYFLLVRYARSHALCRRNRGPDHRPLCPGLLRDTHCLWEWATRDRGFRRGCLQGRNWDVNKHFFGHTDESQEIRRNNESRAWYDLIQTGDIVKYANLQPDPDTEDSYLQSVMWC